MQTKIQKMDLPENRRIIVISDIHGHYYHLKKLLKKVGFTRDDILFILGDIVEKGPLSLKTLRLVIKLQEDYEVYPLIGNVDETRLSMYDTNNPNSEKLFQYMKKMLKNWEGSFFTDMCNELGIHIESADDIQSAKEQINIRFKKELDFLRNLPTIIETDKFILVHGGIPSTNVEELADKDAHSYLKNDAFMEKGFIFDKYVIVGHWPVTLYNDKISTSNPIINKKQKIISIDGGCGLKRDGQLNALIIQNKDCNEFQIEHIDELPVGIAQTPQEKSDDSINIRYTDNKIKIIEKGEEFSLAEHITSGYRLWIQNDYIKSFDEHSYCDDYTDYKVPVNTGDKLSIVTKTSKGYLVKKDGISGWYYGVVKFPELCQDNKYR